MANLTLKIPDEDLKLARLRAVRDGTSVNAVVRQFLREYGERAERVRDAVEDVLRLAEEARYSSGGRSWKREDLYGKRARGGR